MLLGGVQRQAEEDLRVAGAAAGARGRARAPVWPGGTLGGMQIEVVAARPRIYRVEGFIDAATTARLLERVAPGRLTAAGLTATADATGVAWEVPIAGDAELTALARRIEATLGIPSAVAETLRCRRYREGDAHPLHHDAYVIGEATLIVTAMVTLVAPEAGGETAFPAAEPAIAVRPAAGSLLAWHGFRADGAAEAAALHEGRRVLAGEKVTLTYFIYQRRSWVSVSPPALRPAPSGARLWCVNDRVPAETTSLLARACAERGVAYEEVDARSFDFAGGAALPTGSMLFRPAVSRAARRVEYFLWAPGVATLHREAAALHAGWPSTTLLLQRSGVPVARTTWVTSGERARLRAALAFVGGPPAVLKGMGSEGGVGVVLVESLAGLFSVVDLALAQGMEPELCEFIAGSIHWRLVVVGDAVVASYPNPLRRDDFRSAPAEDPEVYVRGAPSAALAEVALRAVAAHGLDFGGVDLLVRADGSAVVLEVNFPCYFPQAQEVAGIDVAGAIVERLLERRAALLEGAG